MECCLQYRFVSDEVLLKSVQKRGWGIDYLRFLNHHHTLKVGMNPGWSEVGTNSNVSVIARAFIEVINSSESLIEEVIEALVNIVSLTHDYSVTYNDRVTNSGNGVNLLQLSIGREVAAYKDSSIVSFENSEGEKETN